MNFIKVFLFAVLLSVLNSCASTSNNKSHKVSRTEHVPQVSDDSPEMKNLELGVGYLRRGKEADVGFALEKFKKAISINPKFALAHSMLANVYDKKGLFDSAEKHYKLSMKHNNGSPDILNNYANFLCQRGNYDLAIENYKKVVENPQYKTPVSAYENAGVCAQKGGHLTQSENFFRQALAINPKSPNSLYYLMTMKLESGNYMKARAFLQRLENVIQPTEKMLAAGYEIERGLNNKGLAQNYLTKLQSRFPSSESYKKLK